MATKVAPSEKLYECEVKRRRVRANGPGYEPFWKVKSVKEAVIDGDTEYRCKDCHGPVKLHKRSVPNGPAPHVQHKLRSDSEHCVAGVYFQQAADGREPGRREPDQREPRLSAAPID